MFNQPTSYRRAMSPPVLLMERSYKFFINSREDSRMHVHVCEGRNPRQATKMARFWLEHAGELEVSLDDSPTETFGFSPSELVAFQDMVEEHLATFVAAWQKRFPRAPTRDHRG